MNSGGFSKGLYSRKNFINHAKVFILRTFSLCLKLRLIDFLNLRVFLNRKIFLLIVKVGLAWCACFFCE